MSKRILRSIDDLISSDIVPGSEREQLQRVADKFSVAITPHVLESINGSDGSGAMAAQFVPSALELEETPDELDDPIGDLANSAAPGVIRRYKDRVLLNVIQTCAVYCRYCFRREQVGAGQHGLTADQLKDAIAYIEGDTDIWEVIFSGGDPLTLSARRLSEVIKQVSAIDHVGIIRFHTRMPAVAPDRVTEELICALKLHPATYLVLHINHADELTAAVVEKIAMLADAGIPLLSQSVLLKGVNDNVETLTKLFRTLLINRIKPYYLHHCDLAKGTSHFRTSIEHGQSLMRALRGPVSGLCQPHYVLDLPGGQGKVPVGPNYLEQGENNEYTINDVFGGSCNYRDTAD